MPVPLLAVDLRMPPDLVEVRAGDVDGDGRDELVLVSRPDRAGSPPPVTLTVVHLSPEGREEARQTLALGAQALAWDIQGGLWALDGEGVLRLHLDGRRERLASLPTPLSGLGPTSPVAADLAHDLDQDGQAEVLVWSHGALHVIGADGRRWGALAAPAEGQLSPTDRAGGTSVVAATRPPPLAVADLDGNGVADLVLPAGAQARVGWCDGRLGSRVDPVALPHDLDPPEDRDIDRKAEERRVARAWFQDLTADGRADLLIHRTVTRGSWFGTTAELVVSVGTGAAFPVTQRLQTDAAAVDVLPLDFEGDGDLDLLVPQVETSVGNLASALVSKAVRIDPVLYVMHEGRYGAPVHLEKLKVPVEDRDRMQLDVEHDLDGDGIVDLVSNGGEDRVAVHLGRPYAFATEPLASLDLPVASVGATLFVQDLTGDGRAEILAWRRHQPTATLLRLP